MEHDAAFDAPGRLAGRQPGRLNQEVTPGVRRKPAPELDPLLRAALDCARPGLIVLDNERRVRLLTRAAAELLGVAAGAPAQALPVMRLLAQSPWLDDAALQTLAAAFGGESGEPREVLLSIPRPGGARVVSLDLRRARGEGWVASLEDVTQSRETQDWLVEHASTDPVTGLWNRQHFMLMLRDRLDMAVGGTTVLLLDLKRLKGVNDTLGTATGDALLRLVGGRLLGFLRSGDLLCRFVSDEFAVMLGETASRADIAQLGRRLAGLIEQPFLIEGQIITIGAHVGAACAPEDGDSPEVLVAHAALALAAARAEARGEMRFFEPKLDDEARRRRALDTDLRLACARGEFELHYQPQFDLRLARVTGFEALVRWRSPSRGLVPPNSFIPLLEQLGLIGDVGDWVVRTACREAAGWPDGITVAVNASPLQVEAGDFGERVARALADTGLPGHRLEVEITENLLLRDNANVMAALRALREMGVGLVLDDFGTGYASLSALTRFHFDKIKIDRSFISAPDATEQHAAIVRAIAALGISLGVPTTAEGVETVQQLNRVRDNGCISVQGYYYSKPVPAERIPDLLVALNAETVVAV
jgi:diguanylate cyclase (GGDEF)-like protein